MNRDFYFYANYFLGISVLAGLFQSLIYFKMGGHMYFLQPYANWFLVVNIISLIGTGFLLRYFYYQNYRFSFYAGAISGFITLGHFIFTYIMLILVARELYRYNIFLLLLFLGAGIGLALSFVFSSAHQKTWLKTAGICMLGTHLVYGVTIGWSLLSQEPQVAGIIEKIGQWCGLAATLIPLFFILNFRRELKLLPPENVPVSQPATSGNAWALAGILALFISIFFGYRVARESYWSLVWREKGPAQAQQLAQAFRARTYVNNQGDSMRYLFMTPLAYDSTQKYPLVVCLHGGPIPLNTDMTKHVELPEPAPLLAKPENREKYPAFLLVPQGPPGYSWGGVPNSLAADSLVFQIMQELEKEFAIDEKRRYVAGGSGGGYGSWYFIGTRPEIFAAAIPFCGAGNPELAKNMVNIPVWAFHGDKDRNVPVRGSRDMIAAIRKAGGHPRYTEFPGTGHNVWPDVAKTPGLLDWLFAQKKN